MEKKLDNFSPIGDAVKIFFLLVFLSTVVPLVLFILRKALNKKVS